MEPSGPSNPLLSLSTFIHHHCLRLDAEFSTRISDTTRFLGGNLPPPGAIAAFRFCIAAKTDSYNRQSQLGPHRKNSGRHGRVHSEQFQQRVQYFNSVTHYIHMLIMSMFCGESPPPDFEVQVRLWRRELRSQAQVYMLKVEGIAFCFLPDPVQIKNALELKAVDIKSGFDGVPVFQVCYVIGCTYRLPLFL
ncbi:hypothetical protein H0E87_004711 [Populus deltoides]|uniref:Uncharacterized protein n=1 Tax=Populus deltoides TaxID=3696 RepID=A0A8T2ZGK6_POPDE|nr:hypothetical protein H0E87_004711 [Populus deltoides]